jgi:hypothetical protein
MKKAVLVGINYFGQNGELRGCINDVQNMIAFLTQNCGFSHENMVVLTDDQQAGDRRPTRGNIENAMRWLLAGAQPGDSLFFHYSGMWFVDARGCAGEGVAESCARVDESRVACQDTFCVLDGLLLADSRPCRALEHSYALDHKVSRLTLSQVTVPESLTRTATKRYVSCHQLHGK